jgi:hypothetical protein
MWKLKISLSLIVKRARFFLDSLPRGRSRWNICERREKRKEFFMKRFSGILLGLFLLIGFVAHSALAQLACSNATLKGTYLYAYDGWEIKDSRMRPFAVAGIETYNGDGTMRGIFSESTNGVITGRNVGYTGTYTIRENCTGEQTFTDDNGDITHADAFIAPSGEAFTFVQTDPGVVAASSQPRVRRRVVELE